MIKCAVIGYGLSARVFHLPFLNSIDDFKVVGVSTRQQQELNQDYPQVQGYSDPHQLLDETDAELVVITAPNDVHFELAAKALGLGKHVVLEKPFVTTAAEGEELIKIASEQQRHLSVYHNRRWDSDFVTLRALIESGRLGELKFLESHFDRFRPIPRERWREQPGKGTGIWFDLGSHLLDQALHLLGTPQQLTASLRAMRPGSQTCDYFHVVLHYPDKELVLHSSPFCAGTFNRFVAQGTLGSYTKQGLDPQEDRLRDGIEPVGDWAKDVESGILNTELGSEPIESVTGGYQHYYLELAAAIRGEGSLPVPAAEALECIRLLELAEQSSREGRTLSCDQQ
ncbi:oxidoreductase [Dongshaea marina]|uniref:oxidoreductase n=1 Tax=Dongshaea marina TaxID=2047966 RepID=UPI000D3EC7F6|nr:oxidoreductase [Dongshaea marina]